MSRPDLAAALNIASMMAIPALPPPTPAQAASERAPWRQRLPWAVAALVTVSLGLGARAALTGWTAKVLGVVLWATLVSFLILGVAPRLTVRRAFLLCVAISFAVEFFQLSGVPMRLHALHPAFALVFGTTFSALDLPAYAAGAGLGALVHATASRVQRHRPHRA